MESHPIAPFVRAHCQKYPAQAASIFQTYLDLSLAQQWTELEVVDFEDCQCVVLRGKQKNDTAVSTVYPSSLAVPVSLEFYGKLFKSLHTQFPTPETSPEPIYLAVVERDSSCVYYVLRSGIVSPKD